jgi:hypothetical protein
MTPLNWICMCPVQTLWFCPYSSYWNNLNNYNSQHLFLLLTNQLIYVNDNNCGYKLILKPCFCLSMVIFQNKFRASHFVDRFFAFAYVTNHFRNNFTWKNRYFSSTWEETWASPWFSWCGNNATDMNKWLGNLCAPPLSRNIGNVTL